MLDLRLATAEDSPAFFELHELLFRPHIEQLWGWDEAWQRQQFQQAFEGSRHRDRSTTCANAFPDLRVNTV